MTQYIGNSCPVGIHPYAIGHSSWQPKALNLNYTCQDFYSLKTKLLQFLEDRYGPNGSQMPNTFNDYTESDLAIALIENTAFAGDTLSFKIDQVANDLFMATVTQLDNAFRLAQQVGFQPQPPIAASTMWSASISAIAPDDVVLTAPVVVSTIVNSQQQYIELFPATADNQPIFDQDIVIPAGSVTNTSIIGLQGNTLTELFTSAGGINQNYGTGNTGVLWDSVSVQVDGIQWQQVEFFTDSNPRREFRVEFTSNYRAYVMFGNNRAGMCPPQGSQIQMTYRVGGGSWGNIISNSIQFQTSAPVNGQGYSVTVSLSNYTRGIGGYDGDTIEDIRAKVPLWIQTQNRAVSGSDYKTLCEQFSTPYNGKIGKCNVTLRNYGCAGNIIDVYILALDAPGNLMKASNELKVALNDKITNLKMLTDFVCIRDGTVLYVDTSIEIVVPAMYRKFQEQIGATITNVVGQFFALSNWDFGQTLRETDLAKDLASVQYVDGYNIHFTTNDPNNSGITVTTEYYEIIRPANLSMSFTYI